MRHYYRFGSCFDGIPKCLLAYMAKVYQHTKLIHPLNNFYTKACKTFMFERITFGSFIKRRGCPIGRVVPGKCHVTYPPLVKTIQFINIVFNHVATLHSK